VATVALVPHRLRPQAAELAQEAVTWLEARGHEVRVPDEDVVDPALAGHGWPGEKLVRGLDLAVSLGGDGTIIRTIDLLSGSGVPVLGVNVGQLGYLTEVEPEDLWTALDRFFAGDYQVESRMTLSVEVDGAGERLSCSALNEVVLEKTVSGHTVRLAISVNGEDFTTAAADGLIVSTPTGSTAYNFSARGPIVSPRHRAIVVTPVAPHMLFDRSLVLGADESVGLEVLDGRPAALVVDGRQMATLTAGDAVVCRTGRHDARFVTFGGRDFHRILKAKFGLADR
jgi:NAD+ kinase